MPGILDTLKLAGTLVLAIPAALAGLEFLVVRDEPLVGGALVAIAVLLVLVQQYVPLPSDVPGWLAKRAAGKVVHSDDSEESTIDTAGGDSDSKPE